MDKITATRINQLHPKIRAEVTDIINRANNVISKRLTVRIVQGLRTIDEQNALYAKGRTTPGPRVTNAQGGSSYHNYGLAIDIAFLVDGKEISWDTKKDWDADGTADWLEVVLLFTKAGYTWGGLFKSIKDFPHFEKTYGLGWRQMKAKYDAKDFIKNTQYINI